LEKEEEEESLLGVGMHINITWRAAGRRTYISSRRRRR